MEWNYVNIMLYVTGIFTTSVIVFFFAPELAMERLLKISLKDVFSVFLVRHWALLIGLFGLLIICSAHNPEIRNAVLIAASIEKAGLVLLILKNFNREFTRGLRGVMLVDATCVALYVLYLAGIT